ncbi:ORF3 [Human alphaherpesvirus 3]|uniref:Tegument protein UL55 homolog n=3 Tax=Human herpesvirus 3 TaxID=10335 RepID=TEG6_VZVD|nr:nuclear protein UL55 [Human alphaherpesvirus 3]P09268.1 RecName: Full=Tegument protein UL55 homolog [Human herpesvirus 3 strain Dumas]Q4JQX2.1 RecName: Full=Tegument protein UL55 homolog [Human herpesvirus 3 strain Oka vaccine]WRP98687.1 ORF3 [synthetic construct]AAT07684.1 hypothetical protein [Human alphaherpesvirus 3]AAT07761.1 hypothetical protein [Human alphaherpesvirus 3]AAY57622.1 ORF3 [Human alphaherpesvirus 3]AAY57693.1 ORF3 [Human alphaherpesvirus 3]
MDTTGASESSQPIRVNLKPDPLASFTQVIPPLALETTWTCPANSHAPTPSPLYGVKRLCALRATCGRADDLHAFLIGLGRRDKPSESPMYVDLQPFCSLLNSQRLLPEMANYNTLCDAPFSAATQQMMLESGQLGVHLAAIGYHCHCKSPFSAECWTGASEAYDHVVCGGKARAAVGGL